MSLQTLLNLGVNVDRHPKDKEREGAFSVPEEPLPSEPASVNLVELGKHSQGDLAGFTMSHLAFHPSPETQPEAGILQLFCPGLNTAEPEASRRTGYLAGQLKTPLAHFHNGSLRSHGINGFRGKLKAQRDWLHGFLVYRNLVNSLLGDRIEQLLLLNLSQPNPQRIRAAFYSDSTLAYVQAMVQLRKSLAKGKIGARLKPEEIDKLLADTLFVELHGNGCFFLPKGPRYVVWTDINDAVTFRRDFWRRQRWGRSAKFPDPNNSDVVYIDYEGPYTEEGFNAHNLPANGVHVMREVFQRNNLKDSEALYALAKSGQEIQIPKRHEVQGDPNELWND